MVNNKGLKVEPCGMPCEFNLVCNYLQYSCIYRKQNFKCRDHSSLVIRVVSVPPVA